MPGGWVPWRCVEMSLRMEDSIPEHLSLIQFAKNLRAAWRIMKYDGSPLEILGRLKTCVPPSSFMKKIAYAPIKNSAYPRTPMSLEYAEIKSFLLAYVRWVNFEAAKRTNFHSVTRKPDQDIQSFIFQLQTEPAEWNFRAPLGIQLRDGLIAGINIL